MDQHILYMIKICFSSMVPYLCPHHPSRSFPSVSYAKNWVHSCGWSLWHNHFPKDSNFFLLFLFFLWQLHLMYFDCFLPSSTLPRCTFLFPTYPTVCPLFLLKSIKYNLSIYSMMFGLQWGMDNLVWTLTETYLPLPASIKFVWINIAQILYMLSQLLWIHMSSHPAMSRK